MHPQFLKYDAYLFDIDGTLMNVRDGTHYNAFHSAVREVYGIDSRIDGVPVHGNTDIGILRAVARRAGLTDVEFESRLKDAVDHMCCEVEHNSASILPELCPSIMELLQTLAEAGKLLGVVSGNLERIGWRKLEAAGIRKFFSFGCFSDHQELRVDIFRSGVAKARMHSGEASTVCFVGDTPSDIEAARQLGVPIIAVATGIFGVDELRKLSPDVCLGSCAEMLTIA